jgi:hypothetical protein
MANFTQIGLDLQGVLKRTYQNLLYQSSFYKFLNTSYIGEVRQTGTPVIEIIKQNETTLNTRQTPEMANGTTPSLATYTQVLVDLTELAMDYSFRIPVTITGSNIAGALQGQIDLNDSEVAKKIDIYGFDKMADAITGDRTSGKTAKDTGTTYEWSASTQQDYIDAINDCKAILFNLNVLNDYRLGLKATEHAKLVANLTTILKFETRAGVEGVDYGEVSSAYGVMIFPINDNVLTNSEIGYFASPVGVVGDTFFSAMAEYDGNYPSFPGYYVLEGNILFGASVVRPEAIVKLVAGE